MRRWFTVFPILLATACSAPAVLEDVRDESPQFDLGRPGWVRYPARVGSWIGATVGAVGSIALLPITWPISLVAEEPLGYAKTEFLFLPVSVGAGAGHFFVGAPLDSVDFVLRRAWTDDHRATDYEYERHPPPAPPEADPAATGTGAGAETVTETKTETRAKTEDDAGADAGRGDGTGRGADAGPGTGVRNPR